MSVPISRRMKSKSLKCRSSCIFILEPFLSYTIPIEFKTINEYLLEPKLSVPFKRFTIHWFYFYISETNFCFKYSSNTEFLPISLAWTHLRWHVARRMPYCSQCLRCVWGRVPRVSHSGHGDLCVWEWEIIRAAISISWCDAASDCKQRAASVRPADRRAAPRRRRQLHWDRYAESA